MLLYIHTIIYYSLYLYIERFMCMRISNKEYISVDDKEIEGERRKAPIMSNFSYNM